MAGVKGRSGGPRKNAGGKRPGAGRPPKKKVAPKPARASLPEMTAAQEAALGASLPKGPNAPSDPSEPGLGIGITDAKEYLQQVMAGVVIADELRMKAAQALLPFQHRKLGEAGKKDQQKEKAGQVAGRFAAAPPRLAAVGGKTVN